ncbi:MAG TPA: DUF3221 domain-containing protein [Dehalococcoidia bacterium]|nr:DUF3221 domain-containing protein [Dehalococcoidia bacterium]
MRFMRLNRLQTFFAVSAALLSVLAFAAACGDDSEAEVEGDPHVRGIITELNEGQGDIIGTIRIEGRITSETEFDAASLRIEEDTDAFRSVASELQDASFLDLAFGQAVEAWVTGPVAESYPIQAKAARVVILENLDLGEPDLTGEVVSVDGSRIYLRDDNPGAQYDEAYATVVGDSVVFFREGDGLTPASIADLAEGEAVEAWFGPMIQPSEPPMVTALRIVIFAVPDEDDAGSSPEAPSITGTIISVNDDVIYMEDPQYTRINITIPANIVVFREEGGEVASALSGDLRAGQLVDVWLGDIIQTSDPLGAWATRIVILEDAPAT